MENEQVTITLTVAQWQALLTAVGQAPFILVNSVSPVIANLQSQADAQIAKLQPAAAEATQSENPTV